MPGVEHISLSRCRVLYLGSAIPLETAVGLESIQGPCKDRYDNVDSDNRASGIDSVLSIYSSGLLLQYASDDSNSTWFPIQTLHVCAAVKAVGGSGPLRFVSLDTPAAQRSNSPPMFACIMRRTKGIKVLECHVFICKSNQAAMALVQSCMHAFGHKEGWMDSSPVPPTRIVSDVGKQRSKKSEGTHRGGDLFLDRHDLVQKFDVSCRVGQGTQQTPVPMNPPGAPVPTIPVEYFADWNACGGQPLMIIQGSPFYPGAVEMEQYKRKKKKKKVVVESSDSEDETYFVKKSELLGGGYGTCAGGGGVCINIKRNEKCCEEPCSEEAGGMLVYAPQYVQTNTDNVAVAGACYGIYDPESYYCQGAEDQRRVQEAYDLGYYQAELEAYNNNMSEQDDDYCLQEYQAYPGYTDDYVEGYGESPGQLRGPLVQGPPVEGHYELRAYDDYVLRYKDQPTTNGRPTSGRPPGRYMEVAEGLGYYP